MHQLHVVVTDLTGSRVYVLRTSPALLGRLPTNDIQLRDPRASRIHTQLSWSHDGSLTVQDMGSGNRTVVLDGESKRELLYHLAYRSRHGRVELQLGDTTVVAELQQLHIAFVPSEVALGARAAAEGLRRRRVSAEPGAGALPEEAISPSELLESICQSVMEVRESLAVEPPGGVIPRHARSVHDARAALMLWTDELMRSVRCVAEATRSAAELDGDSESVGAPTTGVVRIPRGRTAEYPAADHERSAPALATTTAAPSVDDTRTTAIRRLPAPSLG